MQSTILTEHPVFSIFLKKISAHLYNQSEEQFWAEY